MIPFIDLKTQYGRIEENVKAGFEAVLNHNQYILGPEVKLAEEALAQFTGSKYCLTVGSGTDALLMGLMALDIGPGDEVIIPDFSFFATTEMVELLGATSVFVDIEPDTYNLDPKQLEAAITSNTKVIMPVSLYGQCANLKEINAIATKHNIVVIEDGAQSFGATHHGQKSCNLSAIGCTSFFPSKPLGVYGDGGAIFTNDEKLYKAMDEIRVHGQSGRYIHSRLGINGRFDTLQAIVAIEKLKIFDDEIEKRQVVADRYREGLEGKVKIQTVLPENLSVYAQYTIEVDERDQFAEKMKEKGVPTAVHYPAPLSKQPYFKGTKETCPLSENASNRVISLPFHPYLDEKSQGQIIKAVLNSI